jgi:hypothetical protein
MRPTADAIWKMKLDSVKSPACVACGSMTRWGIGKREFPLCDAHNSWKVYLSL